MKDRLKYWSCLKEIFRRLCNKKTQRKKEDDSKVPATVYATEIDFLLHLGKRTSVQTEKWLETSTL